MVELPSKPISIESPSLNPCSTALTPKSINDPFAVYKFALDTCTDTPKAVAESCKFMEEAFAKVSSLTNPFFTKSKVTNFEEAQTSDTKKFAVFFWEMIKNGVFLPPSQFEAWFLSSAIKENDIEIIEKAFDKGMLAVSNEVIK